MSFQAYLDNIKTKTGKSPGDYKKLAEKKGLLKPGVKAGEIVAWLKKDFDLGHGHAMAIYTVFKGTKEQKVNKDEAIKKHFTNARSVWRPVFDDLMNKIRMFGDDIVIAPASSYLSILRGERKIAVIQITTDRMDIGIKLKGIDTTKRFEAAGNWNAMMTHRVRITAAKQIDKELMEWLDNAYEQNKKK
jgi:hypothetical protein